MSLIYVNYIHHASTDEYEIIKGGPVFATLDTAILDTEKVINKPLVVNIQGHRTVVDRYEYELRHKKFRFVVNEDATLTENPNGTICAWLPIDTDVSKLRFINNQIAMIEEEEVPDEPNQEAQPEPESTPEPKEEKNENEKTNKNKKTN